MVADRAVQAGGQLAQRVGDGPREDDRGGPLGGVADVAVRLAALGADADRWRSTAPASGRESGRTCRGRRRSAARTAKTAGCMVRISVE